MTLLYFAAVYLFAKIVVEHDEDWKAIPLIFLFLIALALLLPGEPPQPLVIPCLSEVCDWGYL